jgi:hypothetical protein
MSTALKGRTHGRTDQACYVKLANPEPSTHGKCEMPTAAAMSEFGGEADDIYSG